jgi:hypothetical protein
MVDVYQAVLGAVSAMILVPVGVVLRVFGIDGGLSVSGCGVLIA